MGNLAGTAPSQRGMDGSGQPGHFQRLADERGRTKLQGAAISSPIAKSRDDDHGKRGLTGTDGLEKLESAVIRHYHVGDDEIEWDL